MEQLAQLRQEYPAWRRSSEEETVNAITHGAGFLLAAAGSLVMMASVLATGKTDLILGCGAYLVSLMSVYLMSTLSHSPTSFRLRLLFRQLDQAFIYLLIVGTYTPFSIAYLHGWHWNLLLAAMWTVGLAGFIAKVFFAHKTHSVPITSYLVLAWVPIVSLPYLFMVCPTGVVEAIVLGGLSYTAGTYFLMRDDRVRHYHAIWHVCVIGGSACHFYGILSYVVHSGM